MKGASTREAGDESNQENSAASGHAGSKKQKGGKDGEKR
jgi:hypothetical protein